MDNNDINRIGLGKYLTLLEMWCMKEFPFNYADLYKSRRSASLSTSSYMLREGREDELIKIIADRNKAILDVLFKYDPTDIFL